MVGPESHIGQADGKLVGEGVGGISLMEDRGAGLEGDAVHDGGLLREGQAEAEHAALPEAAAMGDGPGITELEGSVGIHVLQEGEVAELVLHVIAGLALLGKRNLFQSRFRGEGSGIDDGELASAHLLADEGSLLGLEAGTDAEDGNDVTAGHGQLVPGRPVPVKPLPAFGNYGHHLGGVIGDRCLDADLGSGQAIGRICHLVAGEQHKGQCGNAYNGKYASFHGRVA